MPTPDTNGLPPFADFEAMKAKINELVAKYNNLLVNLDSLNVVSLTADHIDAGTIDANVVTIRSDLTDGAYVQIDGNGMVINNGSFNTFTADINGQVTMTRALIQSSPSGYPKVVMDPTNQLFGAYTSASRYISVEASDLVNVIPYLKYKSDISQAESYLQSDVFRVNSNDDISISAMGYIELTSNEGVYLEPGSGDVHVPSWSKLRTPAESLASVLSGKATSGASTSGVGNHDHGIPAGTLLAVSGGGSVTWVPSGGHAHTQI